MRASSARESWCQTPDDSYRGWLVILGFLALGVMMVGSALWHILTSGFKPRK